MTTLAAVLGFPVGHSLSPVMHNAAFEALGLDWRYLKLPVPADRFEETVRALPASGYRGVNVTIPHKIQALEIADQASEAARAIGAANTLVFEDDGSITADNTDAAGMLDALKEPPVGRGLVLGAGGAGRAAAWALREAGLEVMVWNRTPEKADALAGDLGIEAVKEPTRADILVNATSVGLDPATTEEQALQELRLTTDHRPQTTVIDLPYRDDGQPTPLVRWASKAVDGIDVLIHQGARSFELWTGLEPPLEVMREAVRSANRAPAA